MNLVNDVPLLVGHVGECLVAEDSGVVNQDVDATVLLNRGLDNRLAVLDIALVANGLSTKFLDLLNSVVRVYEVVYNNLGTALGQLQAVDATQTGTSTSDKSNLTLEVNRLALGVGRQLVGLLKQFKGVGWTLRVLRLGEVDNVLPFGSDSLGCEGVVGLEQSARGSFPSQLSYVAGARLEDGACLSRGFVCEDGDEGNDPFGLHFLEDIGRHDGFSHSASGDWGDNIAEDVVLQALLGERLGEANESEFGGCRGQQMLMFS